MYYLHTVISRKRSGGQIFQDITQIFGLLTSFTLLHLFIFIKIVDLEIFLTKFYCLKIFLQILFI